MLYGGCWRIGKRLGRLVISRLPNPACGPAENLSTALKACAIDDCHIAVMHLLVYPTFTYCIATSSFSERSRINCRATGQLECPDVFDFFNSHEDNCRYFFLAGRVGGIGPICDIPDADNPRQHTGDSEQLAPQGPIAWSLAGAHHQIRQR